MKNFPCDGDRDGRGILLVAGEFWRWPSDRGRGILMIVAALVIVMNVTIWTV